MLPELRIKDKIQKSTQIQFRGLYHNEGAWDGSLWDMENMTGQEAPVLATRDHRYFLRRLRKPGGLYSWDRLCWVEDGKFYYDGVEKGTVSPGLKTFGSLGARIVILPDKKYYDVKADKFGSIESRWSGTFLEFKDGTYKEEPAKANTIQAEGVRWADFFKTGDAVTISGCTEHPKNNKTIIIREISGDVLRFYEYSFELDPGEQPYTETGTLKIERTMPDLLYLCESENRLWGCTADTIHASAWGDIFNWQTFDGLDTDSWALTPGTVGPFRGCIRFRGFPIFFKEDTISKIYGSLPRDFRNIESASLGIQEGSSTGMAAAGETLFYLSRVGPVAYNGGIPTPINKAFGTETFRDGVAGSDGLRYFVSMAANRDGLHRLWCYDSQKRSWHCEDRLRLTHMTSFDGNLYGLSELGDIWLLGSGKEVPEGLEREGDFPWFVEFTDFTEGSPDRKDVGKLQLRLQLESEAWCRVMIQYDSSGEWQVLKCIHGEGRKRNVNVPVVPHRCDHYRIRLEGEGDCRIYSMSRQFSRSSSLG